MNQSFWMIILINENVSAFFFFSRNYLYLPLFYMRAHTPTHKLKTWINRFYLFSIEIFGIGMVHWTRIIDLNDFRKHKQRPEHSGCCTIYWLRKNSLVNWHCMDDNCMFYRSWWWVYFALLSFLWLAGNYLNCTSRFFLFCTQKIIMMETNSSIIIVYAIFVVVNFRFTSQLVTVRTHPLRFFCL